MEKIEQIANIVTIIGFLSILFTAYQFIRYKRVEEAKLWLELRDKFLNHSDIHIKLRNGIELNEEDYPHLDAYLGQFELCQPMLQKKLIDKAVFTSQYDYRLHNISINREVIDYINIDRDDWVLFIRLCNDFGYEI